jgi:hypothetical protein
MLHCCQESFLHHKFAMWCTGKLLFNTPGPLNNPVTCLFYVLFVYVEERSLANMPRNALEFDACCSAIFQSGD